MDSIFIIHFHICIFIHIPIFILHVTFTISWNALEIYRPLNELVISMALIALAVSLTCGHTSNLYHIRHTHASTIFILLHEGNYFPLSYSMH